MVLRYKYRITYESGQTYDRKHILSIDVSKDDYKKIIQGIVDHASLEDICGVEHIVDAMIQNVRDIDRCYNLDGSLRSKALKKERAILSVEPYLEESEVRRILKMKSPLDALDRTEEQMTIYRSDGSFVRITSEFGLVKIEDSNRKGMVTTMEADTFIRNFLR